jgi:hypothetical protein
MPVAETSKTTLLLGSYPLTGGTWRQIYPVVVEAVGMCEIAAAISKGGGKGSSFIAFSCFPQTGISTVGSGAV